MPATTAYMQQVDIPQTDADRKLGELRVEMDSANIFLHCPDLNQNRNLNTDNENEPERIYLL